MKKILVLAVLGLTTAVMMGCSKDDDNGLAGTINNASCLDVPEADYAGTTCGDADGGRYNFYSNSVNGTNTVQCVDADQLPQSQEEFDATYADNTLTPGYNLARDGEYVKGSDCASGRVKQTQDADGSVTETRTYVWRVK